MGGSAGPTILVVEDDPSLRMLSRVNLELEGFRVLEAETVGRAEELVAEEPVEVVLLDLHVGERHGLELLPFLLEHAPEAGVCLLSGTSEADPPTHEGVHAFIRKPFDVDELVRTIRSLLARESTRP